MLRATLAGLVVATALVAAACGGGGDSASGADPDQYAATVCGAISDWQKELQAGATTMQSKIGSAPTPAAVKTELVAFMESATKSTEDMLAKVKEVGPPAIEDGEALQRDLEQGLSDAQTAFAQARDKAKELPTDDRAAFQREGAEIQSTLTEEGTRIGRTLNDVGTKYDSSELNEAFDKERACQSL